MRIKTRPSSSYQALVVALLTASLLLVALTSCALYEEVVLDNKSHNLSCDELPTVAEVEEIVAARQDVIRQLEAINPGYVFVYVDTETCPSHADLVINYASSQDRNAIERLIDGETFFGAPYRLRNR